jgi:serine phosphatase RsbU (regulator of sigma subunit)/anti-sigma regulatory factor (Ser/Thr protein kinase)
MYSIRTKILTITLVFIAFLGTAFVLYSIVTTRNYKRLRLEGIEKTVAFETEKVNKLIASMEHGAINLAVNGLLFYESQSYSLGQISALESLRGLPAANGGGFWFEPYAFNNDSLRACIYAYFDETTGEVRLDNFDVSLYDYHSQNWYREIADAVTRPYEVIWTKPYLDDTSFVLMTTAGAGIFDRDGNLLGISIIDWKIDGVVEELSTIKPTENSFVLLCSPEQDDIISSTYANLDNDASLQSLPWDINADSFLLDGVKYLPFHRVMDNEWLLSVQIPENEIFAEVESQNSRFSLAIAFSSVIMLCLAFILITKLINAPIKRLTNDISRLALGNLDTRIEVSSNDELGLLAGAFNKMKTDLKESIEAYTRVHTEKERIATELQVAADIQTSMLPCIFPPFPDRTEFNIFASMNPAKEVGGDFYDFYFTNENTLAVVIGDVSGKGIPAALFMVITRTLIRNCSSCKSPKGIFEIVNNKLCETNETGMFVTAFMGFYNIPTGKFVYVNAGHNPPLVKKRGKEFEFLNTKPCLILGWMEDTLYTEHEIMLEPGDTLFLYTDGVTEAMNEDKELFSEPRLLDTLKKYRDYKPKELLSTIKLEIENFADGAEQADDITMLGLRIDRYSKSDYMLEPDTKELTVEAGVDKLDDVLNFVNTELERNNCPPELQKEIEVAVDEVFSNIVNYAYKPATGKAVIGIAAGNEVTLRFEDSGKPYNPLEEAAPDLSKPLMEREIGGLGVFLVKKFMDTVNYTRRGDKNVFVMKKRIN